MPRDDWAKARNRDIARKAMRSGSFDRPDKVKKRKPKKKCSKKHQIARALTAGIPEYNAGNIPNFTDRPLVIFLKPPYLSVHPVPRDCVKGVRH
jgi:hypothetical protein